MYHYPIFFLDYIAIGKVELTLMKEIMKGIITGCNISECKLLGGETAEMPGMYKIGEYDLAGFACGIVEEDKIITGKNVTNGDIIIGLKSSGIHSNGYSLVRKVFTENEQKKLSKILLTPTKIYVKTILNLLNKFSPNKDIKAIVNITGGGFYDNIVRVMPPRTNAIIEKNSWKIPEIFKLIQNKGKIKDEEMYRTFNMGIGMAIIVSNKVFDSILRQLGKEAIKIGVVKKSNISNPKVIVE